MIGQDKNKTQGRWTVTKLLVYMTCRSQNPWPLVIARGRGGGGGGLGERQKSFHTNCYWYYNQTPLNRYPLNTDTPLLKTVCFAPVERNPNYNFSEFNLLNRDTLRWTLSTTSSVSVLTKFYCIYVDLYLI